MSIVKTIENVGTITCDGEDEDTEYGYFHTHSKEQDFCFDSEKEAENALMNFHKSYVEMFKTRYIEAGKALLLCKEDLPKVTI